MKDNWHIFRQSVQFMMVYLQKKSIFTEANMIYRFLCHLLQPLKFIKILYKIPQPLEDITSCGSDTSS